MKPNTLPNTYTVSLRINLDNEAKSRSWVTLPGSKKALITVRVVDKSFNPPPTDTVPELTPTPRGILTMQPHSPGHDQVETAENLETNEETQWKRFCLQYLGRPDIKRNDLVTAIMHVPSISDKRQGAVISSVSHKVAEPNGTEKQPKQFTFYTAPEFAFSHEKFSTALLLEKIKNFHPGVFDDLYIYRLRADTIAEFVKFEKFAKCYFPSGHVHPIISSVKPYKQELWSSMVLNYTETVLSTHLKNYR